MLEATASRLAHSAGLSPGELSRLQDRCVAVVGLGALGGWLATHLAMLGVNLVLIDHDYMAAENLANQLVSTSSLGEPKAAVRARQVKALNPDCAVQPLTCAIEDLGLAALAEVQLLVSALDALTPRLRVNEIAVRLGLPMLDAAVDGTGRWLVGNVTAFHAAAGSACMLCAYDGRSLAETVAAERPRGCPSWRGRGQVLSEPTLQASAFSSIVAGYQALWAIGLLLGRGPELAGRRLLVSAQHRPSTRVLRMETNPHCLIDHQPFTPLEAVEGPTLGDALAVASGLLQAPVEEIHLHGRTLAVGLHCPTCGLRSERTCLTTALSDKELFCSRCQRSEMAPVELTSTLGPAELDSLAGSSWNELAIPPADVITAKAGGRAVHLLVHCSAYDHALAVHRGPNDDGISAVVHCGPDDGTMAAVRCGPDDGTLAAIRSSADDSALADPWPGPATTSSSQRPGDSQAGSNKTALPAVPRSPSGRGRADNTTSPGTRRSCPSQGSVASPLAQGGALNTRLLKGLRDRPNRLRREEQENER